MLDQDLEPTVFCHKFVVDHGGLGLGRGLHLGENALSLKCVSPWGLHAIVIQAVGNRGLLDFGGCRLCLGRWGNPCLESLGFLCPALQYLDPLGVADLPQGGADRVG